MRDSGCCSKLGQDVLGIVASEGRFVVTSSAGRGTHPHANFRLCQSTGHSAWRAHPIVTSGREDRGSFALREGKALSTAGRKELLARR